MTSVPLSAWILVAMFCTFVGLLLWVVSPRRQGPFEAARRAPFADAAEEPDHD